MLVLKDITNDYDSPSIMDVKLGYTTVCDEYYPPEYPNRLQRLADRRAKDAETTAPHLGRVVPSTLYLTLSSLTKFGVLMSSKLFRISNCRRTCEYKEIIYNWLC